MLKQTVCAALGGWRRLYSTLFQLYMMLTRLKYLITALLAGCMLTACSSDEPEASSCEMKFDIYSLSRSVTTISTITENPFAIFGDMIPKESADDPSTRTVVYENTPVKFINSAWTTPDPQYWYHNHLHSFVAVHPASLFTMADATTQYLNSQLSFSYTLPSDYKLTTDILAATHRRHYIDDREYDKDGNLVRGGADVVYLRFAHLMSQINLAPALADNIMDEEEYIEFRKIELSGFKTKATFKVTPASLLTATQTDDREIEVTGQGEEGSYAIEFKTPVKVKNDRKNVNLFDDDEAIIMVPQTFGADSEAEISFYYTINNDPSIKQVTLPLKIQTWATGKSYTYKFKIDRTGPHFASPIITDWDVINVGNIDVH